MVFNETDISGAVIVVPERKEDDRGFFARTWCEREFEARGLDARLVQCSVSFNHRRGTLRGLHLQRSPSREAKVVRCTRGAIFDVVLDLRPESSTYLRHAAVELTDRNGLGLYIPPGCAHGFQTLTDDAEVFYQMSDFHAPELAHGVRWNDPAFHIRWPISDPIMNERDRTYPDFVFG